MSSPRTEGGGDGATRSDPDSGPSATDALAALLRWEAAGGTWVMHAVTVGSTAVDLITCEGGEVMGQLVSSNPDFVAYVRVGVTETPDK